MNSSWQLAVGSWQSAGAGAEDEIGEALRRGSPQGLDEAAVEAARRFGERAGMDWVADLAYAEIDSPLGRLLAVSSRRGLVRLAYVHEHGRDAVLERLAARLSPRIVEAPAALDALRRELDEYFAGARRRFDVSVDLALARGFSRRVLDATARIPYGSVATYRDVATRAGSGAATRAAGNALGANPVPIVVPCHRVLRTGGGLGGYTGGLGVKRHLLELEAGGPEPGVESAP